MIPGGYKKRYINICIISQIFCLMAITVFEIKKKNFRTHIFTLTGSMNPNPPPTEYQVCLLGYF